MYPLSDARTRTAPAERIAGLDGVRAFAVIVVLWYHAELKGALAAGFLGVDVFFVLSGFLITALLIREHEQSGRIAIGLFYLRRARRLLPALLLTVLLSAVAALLVAPDAVSPLRGDVIASLGYVSNWWQIYSNQSYFASVGRPPLLQHLWSLGIEEQFYVLWPLTLAFVLRRSARAWLAALCVFLAGASTLWMGYLAVRHGFPVEADASRVYFGTDTHAMGLFVGAAGAALVNPWREQRPLSRWRLAAVHWVGFGSLIALIACCCYWRDDTEVLYRGGFLLVSVLSLVLILSASVRGSSLERLFNTPLVVWLGTRSYGLYLFHWPVFALLRPEIDVPFGGYGCFVVRIVTVCLLTELCYRYVERPIRSVHFWPLAGRERKRVGVTGLLAALCFITVATLLYTTSAPSGSVPSDVAAALGVGVNGVPPSALLVSAKPPDFDEDEAGSGADAPVGARRLSSPDVFGESRWVLALGDSVFLGAARAFQNAIDHVQVDAQVGRQARDMVVRLAQLRDGGLLAPQVVIHLGTNGYVTEQQAQRILDALADRERVIVVNASAPRRWVDDNNAMLRRVVQGRANVVLLDWQQLAEGHADYFVSDRVHLTPIGLKVLSREICLLGGFKAPQRLPNFDGDRLPEDVIVTVLGAAQSDPGNAGAAEGVDELLEGGVARASGLPRNDKPMAPDRYGIESLTVRPAVTGGGSHDSAVDSVCMWGVGPRMVAQNLVKTRAMQPEISRSWWLTACPRRVGGCLMVITGHRLVLVVGVVCRRLAGRCCWCTQSTQCPRSLIPGSREVVWCRNCRRFLASKSRVFMMSKRGQPIERWSRRASNRFLLCLPCPVRNRCCLVCLNQTPTPLRGLLLRPEMVLGQLTEGGFIERLLLECIGSAC